ncbi:IclR family transcriptional regulator [Lentibacillus jeotgali]|uniref:IclR family transcriptional regulator n=1 Tax=Lentibacillus jeotgali TaxID=558169 RepID=UPI00026283E7|nr:IclR family transcriptional regulator [Lentibacillus jeotgali]
MTANKVLSILNLFNMERKSLTVDEMAELHSLPKSSVYRHVRTLKEHGYLIEHHKGRYKLGYKFLEYANIVRSDINITEVSHPMMNDLTLEFGETTILSVLSDINAVCLATSTSNQPIKVSSEEGKILPLYSGASSKVILAYQNADLLDKIIEGGHVQRFTDKTLTDKTDIIEDMKHIRGRGYARSFSEVDKGVISIGFPIRNSKGKVFASLAIAGPEYRMAEKDENVLVERFKEAVASIEKFLK